MVPSYQPNASAAGLPEFSKTEKLAEHPWVFYEDVLQ